MLSNPNRKLKILKKSQLLTPVKYSPPALRLAPSREAIPIEVARLSDEHALANKAIEEGSNRSELSLREDDDSNAVKLKIQ
jgi:hypothetical protein